MERRFTQLGQIPVDWDGIYSNRLEPIKRNKREWNANLTQSEGLETITSTRDWNGLKKAEPLNSLEEEQTEEVEH